jgi:hypothetical protein
LVPAYRGIVGSVVLPVLGAVPDGAIILFSGLGSDAKNQIVVGVGALAGSTIMLITLPWFIAVFAGKVSIFTNLFASGLCLASRGVATPFTHLLPGVSLQCPHQGTGRVCFRRLFQDCVQQPIPRGCDQAQQGAPSKDNAPSLALHLWGEDEPRHSSVGEDHARDCNAVSCFVCCARFLIVSAIV